MDQGRRKNLGVYYTPDHVLQSLVHWVVRDASDRMLDPSCGDGRFLAAHGPSLGVEMEGEAASAARQRAPHAVVHQGDFFEWAARTEERFECAAGNPPFIRYQRFAGDVRRRALEICACHGARLSNLTSSWAPFIVGAATLLKRGGRMAFVVPAEIGHAPYAHPVLRFLASRFSRVQVVAIREKVFPGLSEDCWLLFCDGYGDRTPEFLLSAVDHFVFTPSPPSRKQSVRLEEWECWNFRLRPFLLPAGARRFYQEAVHSGAAVRLGDLANVGIGYVTGDNDFFHLRLSQAEQLRMPHRFLRPTVRNGKYLVGSAITPGAVRKWLQRDQPVLLLYLRPDEALPPEVSRYLDSARGHAARKSFKCRTRSPWYCVPNVVEPEAFLSYMTNHAPALVANYAGCTAANSVHLVRLMNGVSVRKLLAMWRHPLTQLSCEIEGHPLGGGMLKMEPGEAARVLLSPQPLLGRAEGRLIQDSVSTLRQWRHYG
jgi:hypothetical protein